MKLTVGVGAALAAGAGATYYAVKLYRQSAASLDPDAVVPQIKAKVQTAVDSARGLFQAEAAKLSDSASQAVDAAASTAQSLIRKAEPSVDGASLIHKS